MHMGSFQNRRPISTQDGGSGKLKAFFGSPHFGKIIQYSIIIQHWAVFMEITTGQCEKPIARVLISIPITFYRYYYCYYYKSQGLTSKQELERNLGVFLTKLPLGTLEMIYWNCKGIIGVHFKDSRRIS